MSDREVVQCEACLEDVTIHFGSERVTMSSPFTMEMLAADLGWAEADGWREFRCPNCGTRQEVEA